MLEITNDGDWTDLHAVGRIIGVEGAAMRRHDTYFMHWMNDWTNQPIVVQAVRVNKNRTVKLAVGKFLFEQNTQTTWLVIMGNAEVADQYQVNNYNVPSAIVTVEVTLTADPPLPVPFCRRYTLQIPRRERLVEMSEVNSDG